MGDEPPQEDSAAEAAAPVEGVPADVAGPDSPKSGADVSKPAKRAVSLNGAAIVAIIAILIVGALIYKGKICGVSGVDVGGIESLQACDASKQLSAALEARDEQEVTEVIGVISANKDAAKEARRALLASSPNDYLAALKEAGRDPIAIETELIEAGFYSQRSPAMSDRFAKIIQDAIHTTAGDSTERKILSTSEYEIARLSVANVALLQRLREQASDRSGPFYPLGLKRVASLSGGAAPAKCQIFVRDGGLHGRWLRIEEKGGEAIVREAIHAIPSSIGGESVRVELQVSAPDATKLRFARIPRTEDEVFVREATKEDMKLAELECGQSLETPGT